MGTIEDYLSTFTDKRLERLELLLFSLHEFQAEPEELDELLPACFTRDLLEDEEVAHYLTYLRKAIHRCQQRQMGPYVPDDADEWHDSRARKEGE